VPTRSSFVLAAVTVGFLCACMVKPDGAGASPTTPPQQRVGATQLYNENCAKCHGRSGEGGGAGTRTLLTVEKFDQKNDRPFFDAIKNGVPDMGMDAYGTTMTDEQIWSLVVHIREMQAGALRAANGSPKATNGVYPSKHVPYRIETVVEEGKGLKTPWSMDWLPDGRMLVANRPGAMYVSNKGVLGPEVKGLPETVEIGQGGLMDVAVHPDCAKNGWIYLAFTDPKKDEARSGMTKIVRGKLKFEGDQATWTGQQTIYEADQKHYTRAGIHFGSRIVFDGKGHVFFVVGERGSNMGAQSLENPWGKIHRVNEDGTIPSDNPFVSNASAIKSIWSYGHRNPQGLVLDLDGLLWDTEHGPRGGDEVNRIEKGANYGWPVVCFGIDYSDAPFRLPWPKADQKINMPVFRWMPSIGACGLDVVRGDVFPQWKGDLVAGGLSGANVDRFRMKDGQLVEREELVHGMGRVREVTVGPEGAIYIALNQPDKIIRLVRATKP
jgi:aldose sugar dehydrogenase